MAVTLPTFSRDAFFGHLRSLSPLPLSEAVLEALYLYYQELARWAPRLALVGPGTVDRFLERHFGESLAALPLLEDLRCGELLDIGSGAGFPGIVLAACRPELRVTLVEARQRKWAFLQAAARRASLPCQCLNARVESPLPTGVASRIDVVTVRALRLPTAVLELLAGRLGKGGRMLFWVGREDPDLPPGLSIRQSLALAGSERRRLVELRRTAALADDVSTRHRGDR